MVHWFWDIRALGSHLYFPVRAAVSWEVAWVRDFLLKHSPFLSRRLKKICPEISQNCFMSPSLDIVHKVTFSCKGVWKSTYLTFSASLVSQAKETGVKNDRWTAHYVCKILFSSPLPPLLLSPCFLSCLLSVVYWFWGLSKTRVLTLWKEGDNDFFVCSFALAPTTLFNHG